MVTGLATADQVREWLAAIPDPEIPVVGIGELGILREVLPAGPDGFEVVITPTYSGCPAMEQIADDIRATLAQHHVHAQIRTRLAPAWSTDWLTEAARDKLRAYGIAAPGACEAPGGSAQVVQFARKAAQTPADVPCPRCGSANTTQTSHFGSTACKALYRCLDCLEPFDYFKPY